jgi:hypothetical protein
MKAFPYVHNTVRTYTIVLISKIAIKQIKKKLSQEQKRTGQDRTGQDRTGQDRTEVEDNQMYLLTESRPSHSRDTYQEHSLGTFVRNIC